MAPPPPPNHSTLEWHPAMAPRPLPQSWPSPSPPPAITHYNGTLQWHHWDEKHKKITQTSATLRRKTQSSIRLLRPAQPWATKHNKITQTSATLSCKTQKDYANQRVHVPKLKLVVTLPPKHNTTMAPSNCTTSTAPCNGTTPSPQP